MTFAAELVTLLSTGLFASGAVYALVAEHPGRTEAGRASRWRSLRPATVALRRCKADPRLWRSSPESSPRSLAGLG